MSSERSFDSRPRPTPTVGQILTDTEQMAVHSDAYFGMAGTLNVHYEPTNPTVVSSTELEALQDLTRFAHEVGDTIERRTGQRRLLSGARIDPESIVEDLRIVGRSELRFAADAIARLWADTIKTSRRGEIIVGVESGGSSMLVHEMVMQALARQHPDLAQAVVPFDLERLARTSSRRSRDRLRYGVDLADDCLISGRQLRNWSHNLIRQGVRPEGIRSQFVSATEERQNSTIVPGTPEPEGVFIHPAFEPGKPSITSTFSASDFGFRHVVDSALESAGEPIGTPEPSIAYPILLTPVREYAPLPQIREGDLPEELRDRIETIEKSRQQTWLDLSALS